MVGRDCFHHALPVARLPADRHADRFAPLADAVIADAIDGAVGPFCGRSGEGLGICVTRRRVDRQQAEALAAVDFEFELVEKTGEAAPIPADIDPSAVNRSADVGLNGREIGAGLLRALDAERLAHRCIVTRVGLDLFYEGTESRLDSRRDGQNGEWKHGRDGRTARRQIAAVAGEVFPCRPLAGAAQHDLLALDRVAEVIGIVCLGGDGGGAEIKGGRVRRNGVFEGLELSAEAFVGGVNGTGFGHGYWRFGCFEVETAGVWKRWRRRDVRRARRDAGRDHREPGGVRVHDPRDTP